MRGTTSGALLLLLGMALGNRALAQEPESERVYQLEEILVTASPVLEGNLVTRYAETASVVSERQIQDLHAQDLPSSLRRVPGVSISRYNLIGNYGGGDGGAVFVRGHGSGRPGGELSTMVDGIPRFNGFWTHPLMDLMSLDIAQRIEVQKSPRPVANGNMSFSAVNVCTRRMEEEGFATSLNISAGSYGTLVGRLSHGGRIGQMDYLFVGSHRQSDGHRDNADGQTRSFYGKLGYRLSESWDVTLLANKTAGWAHDPQAVGTPPPPVSERYETDNEFYLGTATYRRDPIEGWIKAYYDDGYADWRQWAETEQENGISDYANYGIRTQGKWSLRPGLEILFGADWDSYGGSFVSKRPSNPGQEVDERLSNLGPYLMISQTFGDRLQLTPSLGARYNLSSEFGSQLGWQAGAVAARGPTHLHANFAHSFNLPGVYAAIFYRQYWSFAYQGDEWKELKPEWIDHFELGGSHRLSDQVTLDLTWFRDQVKEAIRIVPPPPPPPRMANIGKYRSQGVEGTATLKPVADLRLFAGGSFAHASPDQTPNLPELALTAGLAYTWKQRLRLNLDAEYVGEQYVQGTRTVQPLAQVDGYALVNLRVGWLFKIGSSFCELFANVENLLDEEYEYRVGYPMPGRTLSLGVDFRQ